MPTPHPRRTATAITAAVLVVLLTGAITALMLHGKPLNGRRRAVTTTQVTPPHPPDHSATAPPVLPTGPPTAPPDTAGAAR